MTLRCIWKYKTQTQRYQSEAKVTAGGGLILSMYNKKPWYHYTTIVVGNGMIDAV